MPFGVVDIEEDGPRRRRVEGAVPHPAVTEPETADVLFCRAAAPATRSSPLAYPREFATEPYRKRSRAPRPPLPRMIVVPTEVSFTFEKFMRHTACATPRDNVQAGRST